MKIYRKTGMYTFTLGIDELWTMDLSKGHIFSEKDAKAILQDFKDLDKNCKYWCK